ncbi:cell wall metabolism sensor histidine kinase WalK [Listeria welshimeri]|uniref:histidine kinase n=1 Tax=Listeria welshimeri serovar 6b (strain ATCC 35897 / DSM 20650 / CCUG 15529 / CIP 8149 / NCTC 11857 / SLCC 5334 / V8) TaxID=386043 RepID=A0AF98_LISW6|nr:cell wall metabolism sensor histidine kinase WalK [Listeria welshimeri]MBC1250141.1 cell wall metabolism sensor histidine kinase WalK [Listeria welshimeri]MBC1341906.1 cell wall metabolism sensor histidine kinase WalK [Listeria welshimeri]MBC1342982.1 cell wall metabolism sensor histidine kinase WalK [Listeria welshimeri]MBC1347168.1 cell wall metabolism sensor histidine kinase WalK [Listeria welshimeri]MBC1350603.1 cell wall metabolism sensor histidine kinase WalK [Listeria welshimeri]
MHKMRFFQSVQFKLVIMYLLLIIVAMQVIGAYFVRELEGQLEKNFQNSITNSITLLDYNAREEIIKNSDNSVKLQNDIRELLVDFSRASSNLIEVRIVDEKGKILGTSNLNNQGIVGQKSNDPLVKRTLSLGTTSEDKIYKDESNKNNRVWVNVSSIKNKGEVIGAIYLVADIESVYKQVDDITNIFITGTLIAMVITAILGILLSRTITKPIVEMKRQAYAMARGNYSRKVKVYGVDEIGELADSFNTLTKRVQEAQAMTEGERRKLSSVLAYMTDGVIATDRRGKVILINTPAEKMLRVKHESANGRSIIDVLDIGDSYQFEDLMEVDGSLTMDRSTLDKPYILRANFSVIQRETGFNNGVIAVLHDITDQEKVDQERRDFVSNVSHELRTPLTSMHSYLEALSDGAWEDKEIAPRFLEVTQNETERMIRLVNDLLKLSRMDGGREHLEKSFVNFTDFFNHIIDRFEMMKKETIMFKRHIPKEPVIIEIDEDKVMQVLDNIISNANKYSPDGGRISFYLKKFEDEIEISIADEGLGVPEEDLANVFDRFFRVDKARSREMGGTGLGLAIAREVIEAHGGRIWAERNKSKGTVIKFTLPYSDLPEDDWE